jgi:hypothetical protein
MSFAILGTILSPIIYRGVRKNKGFVEIIDESGRGSDGQKENDLLDGR